MKKEKNNNLILVYYISINHVEINNIPEYMKSVGDRIKLNDNNIQIILIPVFGETKIECINPKYITNDELIKQHERNMSELNEQLTYHISNIKQNKDE